MIAQALRIEQGTVVRHLHDYLDKSKLTTDSGGSKGKFTPEQSKRLIAHLTDHTYAHQHQIVIFIQEQLGVEHTTPGIIKWLHQHGFRYKKPKATLSMATRSQMSSNRGVTVVDVL